jgi:hypothetical protein
VHVDRLGEDIWTVGASLPLLGADIGTRMTVIRIGRDLVLHSPVKMDGALAAEIESLGRVRWLVAPCAYHHLWLGRAKQRWPDAEVLAVGGIEKKQPGLAIEGMLPEAAPASWRDVIDVRMIDGMPRLNEIAVLHRPSKTLLLADFLVNIPEHEGAWGRTLLKMAGSFGEPRMLKLFRVLMKDRAAVRASRDEILDWDFDRVSVCHREVIEDGGKDVFAKSTAWI